MMKLFKKKKSDKSIANTIVQQDTKEFESHNVKKQPKPPITTIPVATNMDAARSSSPPAIIMPKPRRLLTPTRAILGRFDHDKTQVEEEEPNEQFIHQQEISPILLPTPREEPLLPQLVKPVARHLIQPSQQQQYKPQQSVIAASSLSTVMSDDSSRVYESALESLSDTTEEDHVAELPDLSILKKQPSHKPIVNPLHVPLPQQQQQQQQPPSQVQQPPQQQQQKQHQKQQQSPQDIIASGIISDASSRTVSPQYYTRKRANTGPSSGSSAITVTPLQAHNKQTLIPIPATSYEPQQIPPPPQPAQTLLADQQEQQQQQKDDQEFLLRELKKQVELIEKQRIKDREEWNRKEQELLTHRHQMMETLIETKDQLTHVLKNREEENNKAKLTYYDKQLKQQQLHQMQKQVIEMGLNQQQQQLQQQEEDDVDEPLPTARLNSHFYQQQAYYYENNLDAPLDEHNTIDGDEAPMYHQRRIRNRSKSDEQMKHNTRSSSRSSYHYQQQHSLAEDGGRRSSNSRNNYPNEDMPPVLNRKPVSRRASNASNKSNGGHRFDHTSPATTLVSNYTVGKSRRPRARSIESARWHEEQQQQQQQQQMMIKMNAVPPMYMDEMMVPYEKLRKSRSAGRDLHSMRPVSRASSVYNMYYDEGDLMDDELFDSQPSFYDSGYYSNYMDNIPPNKQQQQVMSRYNSDIPYYPPQQQQQPPQPPPPQQFVYSPVDYYYQQQPQPRHNQRYNARHHYSYN
ncbi:hypothetical protein MAM1_0129c06089 [Mucor ambiguus]|uniref:Uncharacterized protein n=1 Tax=Mucor ambiguus TaxID=91626 RepID=A0A0C9MT74_9FUNG|nr:hypothetical protein MAM1_0129c06089 [Mucor ambiguus]